MYVTGDRMRQLLNGWLTDEEHDRLIRFEGGKIVFRCFPRANRDVSLAGHDRPDLDVLTCYLFRLLDRVPRIRFLYLHLSTSVVYRTSGNMP